MYECKLALRALAECALLTGAGGLSAGGRNLLGEIACGCKLFGKGYAIILEEDDFLECKFSLLVSIAILCEKNDY